MLRAYLQQLTVNREPEERIFGAHWRDWIRKSVRRICEAAGVPMVTAHGMRGLHSTLAVEHGVSAHVVAASLGHESIATTIQSYVRPEEQRQSSTRRFFRRAPWPAPARRTAKSSVRRGPTSRRGRRVSRT